MIASTCLRERPVRRAIGFATDLATRPRIPVRDPLPISTALSSTFMVQSFPETRHFETSAPSRGEQPLPESMHEHPWERSAATRRRASGKWEAAFMQLSLGSPNGI
jgi:hypothetical protein